MQYIYTHIRKNIIEYLCTNLYYNFVPSDAWMLYDAVSKPPILSKYVLIATHTG